MSVDEVPTVALWLGEPVRSRQYLFRRLNEPHVGSKPVGEIVGQQRRETPKLLVALEEILPEGHSNQ